MLSHQSGLCALDAAVPLTDREAVVAALSDAGMRALVAGTRPGLDERELAALVETYRRGGRAAIGRS